MFIHRCKEIRGLLRNSNKTDRADLLKYYIPVAHRDMGNKIVPDRN